MRELFIYYRATVDCAGALQAAALVMQSGLQARHAGLQARLFRRPEPADGWHTWMETYALPLNPEGVGDALRQEIETAALALAPWIGGPRHTEVFVPCAC